MLLRQCIGLQLIVFLRCKMIWSFHWSQVRSMYPATDLLDETSNLNYPAWNTMHRNIYGSNKDEDMDEMISKTDNTQQDHYYMPHMKYAINRIFGGNEAQPNSFSYQVGLLLQRPRGLYWCGGSLISPTFILTAAHCVDMASRGLVFLGAHDIKNASEPGQVRVMVYPNNFIIFPTWNPRKLKDDIALVRLPAPVEYNDKIRPIELPESDFEYRNFEGKLAIASGWGRYASGVHAISNVLRYVRLRITNGKVCRRTFPFSYRSTNICTSGANRKSTCNGDSGGPLVMQKKLTKSRVLVGITSFGSVLGCDRGYPAAFTKVASYMDWISDETDIDTEEDTVFRNNFDFAKQFNQATHSFPLQRKQMKIYTPFTSTKRQLFQPYSNSQQQHGAVCTQLRSNPILRPRDDYKIFIFHS